MPLDEKLFNVLLSDALFVFLENKDMGALDGLIVQIDKAKPDQLNYLFFVLEDHEAHNLRPFQELLIALHTINDEAILKKIVRSLEKIINTIEPQQIYLLNQTLIEDKVNTLMPFDEESRLKQFILTANDIPALQPAIALLIKKMMVVDIEKTAEIALSNHPQPWCYHAFFEGLEKLPVPFIRFNADIIARFQSLFFAYLREMPFEKAKAFYEKHHHDTALNAWRDALDKKQGAQFFKPQETPASLLQNRFSNKKVLTPISETLKSLEKISTKLTGSDAEIATSAITFLKLIHENADAATTLALNAQTKLTEFNDAKDRFVKSTQNTLITNTQLRESVDMVYLTAVMYTSPTGISTSSQEPAMGTVLGYLPRE